MVSEEKIKVMTKIARYEKKQGPRDQRIHKFSRKDYVRYEGMKMAIAVTAAFLIITAVFAVWQLEWLLSVIRSKNYLVPWLYLAVAYVLLFVAYLHFTRKRARMQYWEARLRMKEYQKHLNELADIYLREAQVDDSPTIDSGEKPDGTSITI